MKPLQFLKNPPLFLFFTGKGGVGKTSLACATAIHLTEQGQRVLIVSTDPASNVGQVFGTDIGNSLKTITAVPGLSALEIDPQATAQAYRDRIVGPVRGVLPESVVKSIEEQLSGACTTEIAAFDEFTTLLTDATLLEKFDHIVFDTAPTGHTIRMLQLPAAWSNFLTEGKGDASCLGPLSGLEKQRSTYQNAVSVLSDPKRTRMILVARAQRSSLLEAARTHEELANLGLSEQHLVINGILPESEIAGDALATAIWKREQSELLSLPSAIQKIPADLVPLCPFNLVGVPSLRQLLSSEAPKHAATKTMPKLPPAPDLASLVDRIVDEGHGHGLLMLMGKGGVGKTTMASAIALALAGRGFPVHLTTSDPAAHLQETLGGALENLIVSRIDPHAETEKYRQAIMASKGQKLDENGRKLLEEDLRSPCTEEIAVFHAFSRIIREARNKFVVMDTAPTGHTLLLLDATGAYHRDIARQLGSTGMPFTTPMMQLQDPQQTKVLIVTLAETTPVLEAANLQAELRRAGIEPWAWIINNSLALAHPTAPLLQERALNELPQINAVVTGHASRYAIVPFQAEAPIGVARLQTLGVNLNH
ncbi:MAG: arsenical pump-driving ATPase [Bdellovibrionales bacterium GWA2_49_15]|nr:MAG: arsenical pump-driving ATPase [Bdellovibrionales bacterium GWA2_49_15]